MFKVERYECEHCKKLFKINRHFCFKDPSKKACATCKHYIGVETERDENGERYDVYLCGCEGKNVIYDANLGDCEVPFNNRHGKRGYNCDWWELIKKQEEK